MKLLRVGLLLLVLGIAWGAPQALASGDADQGPGGGAPGSENAPVSLVKVDSTVSVDSPQGRFSNSVPIHVPEFRGIEPTVSLQYSAGGGFGSWLGKGWSLSTESVVERMSPGKGKPNYKADSFTKEPETDIFVLDGQELVPTEATVTTDPYAGQRPDGMAAIWNDCHAINGPVEAAYPSYRTYCTKVQSFQRILWIPSTTAYPYPEGHWEVLSPSGIKRIYTPISGEEPAFRWRLARVQDPYGNEVNYFYTAPGLGTQVVACEAQRVCYLDHIEYGPKLGNPATSVFRIDFLREERPQDERVYLSDGKEIFHDTHRLNEIRVSVQGARVRKYVLTYDQAPLGRYSRLRQVQQYGKDPAGGVELRLPPKRFDYYEDSATATGWTVVRAEGSVPNIYEAKRNDWLASDPDGDGVMDLIEVPQVSASTFNVWSTKQSQARAPFSARVPLPTAVTMTKTESNATFVNPTLSSGYWLTGDFNADGESDLLHAGDNGDSFDILYGGVNAQWSGGAYEVTEANGRLPAQYGALFNGRFQTGDFNGDGYTDLMHAPYDVDGNDFFWVWTGMTPEPGANGRWLGGPFKQTVPPGLFAATAYTIPVDVNADGLTDLVMLSKGAWQSHKIHTFLRKPQAALGEDAFDLITQDLPSGAEGDCALPEGHWTPGDFNGDGLTDLAHAKCEGKFYVYFSKGNGQYALPIEPQGFPRDGDGNSLPYPSFGFDGGWWQSGDFNGDGKTDLAHVAKPESFAINLWYSVGDGLFTYERVDVSAGASSYGRLDEGRWQSGDFNGDGVDDLVHITASTGVYYWFGKRKYTDGLMSAYTNTLGGVTEIDYAPSSAWWTSGWTTGARFLPVGTVMPLVRALRTWDGRGTREVEVDGSSTIAAAGSAYELTRYDYAFPHWSHQERTALGFWRVTETTVRGGVDTRYVEKEYRQNLSGIVDLIGTEEWMKVASAWKKLRESTFLYGDPRVIDGVSYEDTGRHGYGELPYKSLLLNEKHDEFDLVNNTEVSRRTVKTQRWDAYGNVTRVVDYGQVAWTQSENLDGDEVYTETKYLAPSAARYFADRKYEEEVMPFLLEFDSNGQPTGMLDVPRTETYTRWCYDSNWGCANSPQNQTLQYGHLSKEAYGDGEYDTCIEGFNCGDWDFDDHYKSFSYDTSGNLLSIGDPLGTLESYAYEPAYGLGNLLRTKTCKGSMSLNYCTQTVWDKKHLRPAQVTGLNNEVTTFTYDLLGRSQSVTYPAADASPALVATWTFFTDEFDPAWGNPSAQYFEATSTDGIVARTYYDGLGRTYQTEVESAPGRTAKPTLVTETDYWYASELPQFEVLPRYAGEAVHEIEHVYDALDREVQVVAPDGATTETRYGVKVEEGVSRSYVQTLRAWDGADPANDPAPEPTEVWNDGQGRAYRIREIAAAGGPVLETGFTYKVYGALRSVWDATVQDTGVHNARVFSYNSRGELRGELHPDLGTIGRYYYADGSLEKVSTSLGSVKYEYVDYLRRVTKKTLDSYDYPPTTHRGAEVIQYFYDGAIPPTDTIPGMTASQVATNGVAGFGAAKGNLTAMLYARSGGKEFHSWNALGEETQAIRCVDGKCETEKFAYDAGKRIAQLTYPDGEVVTHTYDGHGNLEALQGAASYANTMQWNARGQVVQAGYGNGVAASYGYDAARGWLDAAEVRGPKPSANTLLYRASYTYRADAQAKTVRSTTNARMNMSFVYDNLTRLTTITPRNYAGAGGLAHPLLSEGATTQTYAYDAIGNVTQNSAYFGSTPYTYDDKGHLLTAIGGLRFNYRAGAITTIWGSVAGCALVEPRVFFWDAEQRLVRATQAGATVNFEYDASGQRIRKASQGSVTRFFGSHAEREEKNGQETRTQYYYAGSQLVAKKTQAIDASGASVGASDTVWFHSDHLTSTRLMTDASGAKAAHYDYAIFGEKTHESGVKAAANQKGFTSHEHDDELGLIYMKARYYDPVLGRFISPDSIIPEPGDPQSWNRYAYVRNNPFNAIDPTGHFDILGVTNVGTRSLGVVQAVGGASESALGGMVAAGGSATGVGAVPGIAAGSVLFTHGVDQAVAGFNTALTGEFQTSGTTQLLTGAGMDPTMAERTDQATSLAGGLTAAKSLMSAAPTLTETTSAAKGLGANPFKNKTAPEVAEMLENKGYVPKGTDPAAGQGTYVNPKSGRGYHIDADHPAPKGPHVGVHRPREVRDTMKPRDYPMGDS